MVLTKDDLIQAVQNIKTKPVEVPDLGTVFVRRLTGGERDEWDLWRLHRTVTEEGEKAGIGTAGLLKPGTTDVRATLVSKSLCDEEGKRLFQDNEIPILSGLDGNALDYLYDAVRDFNGLRDEAAEEAEKNSDDPGSDDSGSSSPGS